MLDKFIDLVYQKHLLESAIGHYESLETIVCMYPCNEFEQLSAARNKLYELLETVKRELASYEKGLNPSELAESRKLYVKRYKLPFRV